MSDVDLISAIQHDFQRNWQLNDEGHREPHFNDVYKTGLTIVERVGEQASISWRDILMVAYFHDLFAWSRNNHHLMSKAWILTTTHPIVETLYPDAVSRNRIANACGEHRASYSGEFSTLLSEVMSSADRGIPGQLDKSIERSIAYNLHHGVPQKNVEAVAISHIKERYGRTGYARYPVLYKNVFAVELEQFWNDIDQL